MTSGLNPSRPTGAQLQAVFALYSERRLDEALELADRLLRDFPDEALLHNLRGFVLLGRGEIAGAIESHRRAVELAPDVADAHFHLGVALMERNEFLEALESFRNAVEIRPDYVEAHGKLCQCLERSGRIDDLADALAEARRHCPPEHPALLIREGELHRRRRDDEAARRCLEQGDWHSVRPEIREARAYLLADVCDRLDDASAAIEHANEANQLCQARADASIGPAYLRQIDELTKTFTAEWVSGWSPVHAGDDRVDLVFIVGFPRSGTTLLDTILRSHSRVSVIEEAPAVHRLETTLREFGEGSYPGALPDLDADAIGRLRDAYFGELLKHVPAGHDGDVLVDKLPLNLVHAGLLHRVFPRARFVFALRHPCDAVLSCYLRAFQLDASTVFLTHPADAAGLYDRVMTLWERYRTVLPLAVHELRYEALLEDFDGTVSSCLAFLGLDWEDGLRDYTETARKREAISTPSYTQVTQPLYQRASGRWQRYREFLEPVLPKLRPWTDRFGYDSGQ